MNVNGDEPLAAFPATSVVIQHAGREPVLANPNHVIFYGPGTRYRRMLHDARGDRCLFVNLRPAAVGELLDELGVSARSGEIPFEHGPSDAHAYARLRVAAARFSVGVDDVLELEDAAHEAVVGALERGADLFVRRRRAPRIRTEHDHHRLVEGAKELLTERATQRDSLETLARMLHTSAFHLGRIFRAHTGFSLHAYRTQLRLRLALDRLAAEHSDLGTLALELGFNSHSHFTGAFCTAFSTPPSQVRKSVEAALVARS